MGPFLSDKLNEFPGCHSELQWFCGMRLGGGERELEGLGDEYQQFVSSRHDWLEWIENTLDTTMVFFFPEKINRTPSVGLFWGTTLRNLRHTGCSTTLQGSNLLVEFCIVRAQRRKASSGLKERIMWQGPQFHSKDSSSQIESRLSAALKMHTDNKKRWENGEGWYNVCDMFWLGYLMCKLDTSVRSI